MASVKDQLKAIAEMARQKRAAEGFAEKSAQRHAEVVQYREFQRRKDEAFQFDRTAPEHMGWRVWWWDVKKEHLISPMQKTVWHTAELHVPEWNDSEALRGVKGIHAVRMPKEWELADPMKNNELKDFRPRMRIINKIQRGKRLRYTFGPIKDSDKFILVDGIAERYGKFVLGDKGWRAEWAIIRKLRAPNDEIGLKLERLYPDVEVYYGHR